MPMQELYTATHSAFFEAHGLVRWDTVVFWTHPLPSPVLSRIVRVINRSTVNGAIRRTGAFVIWGVGFRYRFVFNLSTGGEVSLMMREDEVVTPVDHVKNANYIALEGAAILEFVSMYLSFDL
ncbi:uncharacterized protein MELLADRAFT_100997 [Melampsora larici-populina 98AG31]|uniref:Uncharacterized protein n=1 Tax=Melampsora larici-populina (strain 98AG31 / pathotype 3-4-7) TaxID=747676 RepID=F4R395_MELLP|nr:uncharacterized protein MELLADRAFT_100997 [Melampsora larici-populina 98AG31]EGG12589.1 hypothetical protein MELLADRAFT_100997 [Melampsora larici-populina 98AG31]